MKIISKLKQIICMFIFSFCPIKKGRILFMSYYGKHTNCNPFAIYEEIKRNDFSFECVWVDNEQKVGDKSVKYKSFFFYYYIRTSQFLIFNARPNFDIKKRKQQRYIQTWHSSLGFKRIEKDAESTLDKVYVKKAKKDSKYIDLLISGCKFRTECFKRNFWYDGEIAEIGTPRNDVLFSQEKDSIAKATKKELGIAENTKVVMYAPTFRNSDDLSYVTSLNVDMLLSQLKNKFSGDWVFVYRLHPNVSFNNEFSCDTIDASKYKDMQALLLMSDILLTDYSSVMFDFMLLNKPIFIYASDYEDYVSKERNVYFTIDELPFDMCTTNKMLEVAISEFNEKAYCIKLQEFKNKIGTFECGLATQKILNWIKVQEKMI